MKRSNWVTDNLLISPDADLSALLEMPDSNPLMGDENMDQKMAEMRENITGFSQYSEDTWLSYKSGDTAIVAVNGMIVPEGQPWNTMFGVTPLNILESEYRQLEADPSIKTIITKYNSPGGVARGLSGHHKFLSGLKTKTIGYTEGVSASASYFAMTANDEIVAEELGSVGSIGTIVQIPKQDENYTTIVSDQSPYKDRSDPRNRHVVQAMTNELTDIFIKYVALGRNTTAEKVKSDFGQGDVLLAEKAMERGMIDRVATFQELVDSIVNTPDKKSLMVDAIGELMNTSEEVATMEDSTMNTVEELMAEKPDLFAEVEKSVQSKMQDEVDAKMSAESERIAGVMGIMSQMGDLSPAQAKAAIELRDAAILDPKASVADVKANMAMAALTAKDVSNSTVAQHNEVVAVQAEEQGNITPEATTVVDDGKKGAGLVDTFSQLETIGVKFGGGN